MKTNAKNTEPKYQLGFVLPNSLEEKGDRYQQTFHHRKTGKKYITRNLSEMWAWQEGIRQQPSFPRGWEEVYNSHENARAHIRIYNYAKREHQQLQQAIGVIEDRVNKFWEGAVGYERVGEVAWNGITRNGFRMFLKTMRNRAAMEGDKEAYNKARNMDAEWYGEYPVVTRLALPAFVN